MDYICKRKNNIKSISITADCTGPRDKEGSQQKPMPLPVLPTLDWNLRPVVALLSPTLSVWPVEPRPASCSFPTHLSPADDILFAA